MSLESLSENRRASLLSQTLKDTEKYGLSWGLLEAGSTVHSLHSRARLQGAIDKEATQT